jgi:hypothetical protein
MFPGSQQLCSPAETAMQKSAFQKRYDIACVDGTQKQRFSTVMYM